MLPPEAYPLLPASSVLTKFCHTSTNKNKYSLNCVAVRGVRCAFFCVGVRV